MAVDVGGSRNDTSSLSAPLTLDGPVRVTTEGGYAQIAGPVLAPNRVLLTGIGGSAQSGVAANPAQASADPGQTIVLQGQGFTSSTLVQFTAVDDKGVAGTVTRTGTASSDGRTLERGGAGTGRERPGKLAGVDTGINLQVVPGAARRRRLRWPAATPSSWKASAWWAAN